MALVKCKDCGTKISAKAKACPTCGAVPAKKTSAVTWLAAIVIVPVVAFSILSDDKPSTKPARPELTAEQKAEREKSSMQYATVMVVKKMVQASLKDPESAKFGAVFYRDPGHVCGYINAKNSYGGFTGDKGFVVNVATSDLKMQDSSKSFASTWNKVCVD